MDEQQQHESVLRRTVRESKCATIAGFILVAMHYVETIAQKRDPPLTGAAKLTECINALYPVVDEATYQGLITWSQNEAAKEFISLSRPVVLGIIETIITVSHNPAIVQLHDKVTKCCGVVR